MLNKLKEKWGVGPLQLVLILCTFAIGGSLSGYLAKLVMGTNDGFGMLWLMLYIVVVTLLWPFCVLGVSIFFGQFPFFKKYLAKMGRRIGLIKKEQP